MKNNKSTLKWVFFIIFQWTLLTMTQSFTIPSSVAKCPNYKIDKIVGGVSTKEPVPFQLSLRFHDCHICGAVIIDEIIALTAAHCLNGTHTNPKATDYSVKAGSLYLARPSPTEQVIGVKTIIPHPKYIHPTKEYDVAIIILERPLQFNQNVSKIQMAGHKFRNFAGSIGVASGWGEKMVFDSILSEDLRKVKLTIMSNEDCLENYTPSKFKESMLCAGTREGGADTCRGDSGGPLAVFDTTTTTKNSTQGPWLVGLTSWGFGCGQLGVYTNISVVADWITDWEKKIKQQSSSSSTSLLSFPDCEPGWTPYKEKCVKLIDDAFVPHKEARTLCKQHKGDLLTVKSNEEQEFVTQWLLCDSGVVDNIWLGARRNGEIGQFVWLDGGLDSSSMSIMTFTNWKEGNPTNITGNDCAQIVRSGKITTTSTPSGEGDRLSASSSGVSQVATVVGTKTSGLWTDANCLKRNVVVCQRIQVWSPDLVQNVILELRRELSESKEKLWRLEKDSQQSQQQLLDLQERILPMMTVTPVTNEVDKKNADENHRVNLSNVSVPIGFIYTQLPGQLNARTLWPQFLWSDVTDLFAGLFFRAEGGGSEPFGTNQADHTRRITQVGSSNPSTNAYPNIINVPDHGWSEFGRIAGYHSKSSWDHYVGIRFWTDGGEVRPKNTAVRIWKRVQ